MYLNTLNIGEWSVKEWNTDNHVTSTQTVASSAGRARSSRAVLFQKQRDYLKDFFNLLPKMESHYCRSSSTKLYFESSWQSKQQIYDEYSKVWCLTNNIKPLSLTIFHDIFDELNLSLFRPKKDECETCVAYRTGNLEENAYLDHVQFKDEAREEKTADKSDPTKKVFTVDLQSVLLSPKSNVSALYYKQKLIVHNFTIYELKTHKGYCFIWHEAEGGVCANEFATILCNFIATNVLSFSHAGADDTEIVFYSDGCASQNRNSTLSNALLNLAVLYKIDLQQKILERGHTQMEVDSMHAKIEKKLKNMTINVPQITSKFVEEQGPNHSLMRSFI